MIRIWTDGSSLWRGTRRFGGWAVLTHNGHTYRLIGGSIPGVDAQAAELWAAINALERLKRPSEVTLTMDTKYVIRRMCGEAPVEKYQPLFERLQQIAAKHNVTWAWCPAHAGIYENEVVNARAHDEARGLLRRMGYKG